MSVARKWFGTDGIRGHYGKEPMTVEFALWVGKALAEYFKKIKSDPLFIIGRDSRVSGYVLEDALCRGLLGHGAQVNRLGVVPSGSVSMLTPLMRANAGIVISASHNPSEDNGIKIFDAKGYKLSDDDEAAIEECIETIRASKDLDNDSFLPEEAPAVLDFSAEPIYLEMYREGLNKSVASGFSLKGWTIVLDAANGAAWSTAPYILESYGAKVKRIACEPDGSNINRQCGSTHPETLQAAVKQSPGAIGIALDGDADRLIVVDEDGSVLAGDEILAIIGCHQLAKGELKKNTLVSTIMSNLGLDEAINKAGGQVVRTGVGDRYILAKMREDGYVLGGEQAGHFLFLDYAPSGDGMLSALQLLKVCCETGRPLRELRKIMRKYPQKLYNIPVREKKLLMELPAVQTAIQNAEKTLGKQGRLLVRYSGTEDVLRVLLESDTEAGIDEVAGPLLQVIQQEIGK